MVAGNDLKDSHPSEVYARARDARRQAQLLAAQLRTVRHNTAEILKVVRAAQDRAEQIHELWLTAHPNADRLRYSANARLQARLKSMPVIEQAKGVIMAQFGWPEDQAFDALRRASQRENMKLRDLAAGIVAKTACSASAEPQPDRVRPAEAAREELAHLGPRRLSRASPEDLGAAGSRPGTAVG